MMTEAEIVKYYDELKNKSAGIGIIADLCVCKKSEIRAILERHGRLQPKKSHPRKDVHKFDTEKAMELYQQGKNDSKISEAVGVALNTIYQWRTGNDLPANRTRREKEHTVEDRKINPTLLKIQKLLDMVSQDDSHKVVGQYMDLMITMLSDEVQRIANAK